MCSRWPRSNNHLFFPSTCTTNEAPAIPFASVFVSVVGRRLLFTHREMVVGGSPLPLPAAQIGLQARPNMLRRAECGTNALLRDSPPITDVGNATSRLDDRASARNSSASSLTRPDCRASNLRTLSHRRWLCNFHSRTREGVRRANVSRDKRPIALFRGRKIRGSVVC